MMVQMPEYISAYVMALLLRLAWENKVQLRYVLTILMLGPHCLAVFQWRYTRMQYHLLTPEWE